MKMRKISCGIVIVNEYAEILVGRVTGTPRWDLPKGVMEDDETPVEAAVRECIEEFGLAVDPNVLLDLGRHPYNRDKNIHLFTTYMKKDDIKIDKLYCSSTYKNHYTNKMVNEVDGYDWMPITEIHEWTGVSMTRVLNSLMSEINQESRYGEYRLKGK